MTCQIHEHVLKYAIKNFKVNSTFQLTERSLCTSVRRSGLNVYFFLFISRKNQVRVSVKDRLFVVFFPTQNSGIYLDLGHDDFFLNQL